MPPTNPHTAANPKDNPALGEEPEPIAGPPEESDVWERYNKRMEFPVATVAAVFLHVIVGAILVYVLVGLMDSGEDRSNPPLQLVTVGGMDDAGEGSAGSGGSDSDLSQKTDPFQGLDVALPDALTDPKDNVTTNPLKDPGTNVPLPPKNPGVGGPKGAGNQGGKGNDGSAGTGPGGTGADSTRARGLRWVLRFRVASGRDYLDQLKAMGAEVLLPVPPEKKKFVLIRDLNNPTQAVASDADMKRLAGKIQFSDSRRDQVRDVAAALGVNPAPEVFWAFFPKSLEEELARKETNYRNRRAEDIEETIFRVTVRGGSFELVVDEQRIKK